MIYLDNAATTQIDDRVLEKMEPYLHEKYGNAGTIYSLGKDSHDAVENARAQVASLIGANPNQIIFTSGGSEANTLAFFGARNFLINMSRMGVVTSLIEHESVKYAVDKMCAEQHVVVDNEIIGGFHTWYVPPRKNSSVYSEDVIRLIKGDVTVGLVSIMHTNNETGLKTKGLEKIGKVCRELGVLFHTDCVQALGEDPIDVDKIGCDLLSISSHKIHGPKGVGVLYVRNKHWLEPVICGGNEQEFGLRGGTENVPGIVGFGEACKILNENFEKYSKSVAELRKLFYNCLVDELSRLGHEDIIHINGDLNLDERGKTLNLRFDGIDGETLLLLLDGTGICASAGSACRSHESEPSYVLTSMMIDEEDARNSVRFSFSRMNTKEEVKDAARVIASCVNVLLT